MSSVTRPRGPLPARVYWTRRLLLLAVTLGLVLGAGQLFGGEPGRPDPPAARPAAAPQSSPTDARTPSARPTPKASPTAHKSGDAKGKQRKPRRTRTPLAMPTGPCEDGDVEVVPSIKGKAYAGRDVTITLNLTTERSPACTWVVSPSSVVLKLTSGSDRIWSTQDCPKAVEREQVVLRKERVTRVHVVWSGQRSDDECSRTTLWAEPGWYHAASAALGAEPVDEQFELLSPPRPTITRTPEPSPDS